MEPGDIVSVLARAKYSEDEARMLADDQGIADQWATMRLAGINDVKSISLFNLGVHVLPAGYMGELEARITRLGRAPSTSPASLASPNISSRSSWRRETHPSIKESAG